MIRFAWALLIQNIGWVMYTLTKSLTRVNGGMDVDLWLFLMHKSLTLAAKYISTRQPCKYCKTKLSDFQRRLRLCLRVCVFVLESVPANTTHYVT